MPRNASSSGPSFFTLFTRGETGCMTSSDSGAGTAIVSGRAVPFRADSSNHRHLSQIRSPKRPPLPTDITSDWIHWAGVAVLPLQLIAADYRRPLSECLASLFSGTFGVFPLAPVMSLLRQVALTHQLVFD